MKEPKDIRQAMVLSGGGAYGAYAVGVMKALLTGQLPQINYLKIDPEIYAGTSIGALNAAIMVMQSTAGSPAAIQYLEDVWLNLIADSPQRCGNGIYRFRGDPLRYLDPQCFAADLLRPLRELAGDGFWLGQDLVQRGVNFFATTGNIQTRTLEFVDLSAFVSSEPLVQLVREIISLEAIRRSTKVLRVVVTNWETGDMKVFGNQDMTDDNGHLAILGSAAVPGFFPAQYINGDPYVDGGVVMNTPLKIAIDAGADMIHAIYLDPDVGNIPIKVLQNTYNTLDRTILIHNAAVTNEDAATAEWINDGLDAIERTARNEALSDENMRAFVRVARQLEKRIKQGSPYRKLTIHRYHPERDPGGGGIGILDFNRERIVELIQQGFEDAVGHRCDDSRCILARESSSERSH